MLFNSLTFLGFFFVVYGLYRLCGGNLRYQNILLLASSYLFYSVWDVRFLTLIVASTLVDYVVARRLPSAEGSRRKKLLWLSIVANLGSLAFFKYYNFFAENFAALFGLQSGSLTLSLVLPVGISFYTFQSMSYTIDVYHEKQEPCQSLVDFALYVSFFPQLVAGPIERAGRLLGQIQSPRKVSASDIQVGLYLIVYGYFKKVVVADNLGVVVDRIFDNPFSRGVDIWIGLLAFAFQIYGDFSGYSSIARGLARLLGFDLVLNFNLPYFALTPSEFWNRWHISLSQWLRDYLYIPLGGNKGKVGLTYRNLMLTMILGGLWHGAAWNFILWGTFHGVILVAYRLLNVKAAVSPVLRLGQWFVMSLLTLYGWLLFRCESVEQITRMTAGLFSFQTGPATEFLGLETLFFVLPLMALECWQHSKKDLLVIPRCGPVVLSLAQTFMLSFILIFGYEKTSEFIYFQF